MFAHHTIDLAKFEEAKKNFDKKKRLGTYTLSMNFLQDFVYPLEDSLQAQLAKQIPQNIDIKSQSPEKELDSIWNSPARVNITAFGLGEFLKNSSSPNIEATTFTVVLHVSKDGSVDVIGADNGRGYRTFLDKDTERKTKHSTDTASFDNIVTSAYKKMLMSHYKDQEYKDKFEEYEKKGIIFEKIYSEKQEDMKGGGMGIGITRLHMNVKSIEGSTKLTDFQNSGLETETIKEWIRKSGATIPKTGAIIWFHSPKLTAEFIKKYESKFTPQYRDYLVGEKVIRMNSTAPPEHQDELEGKKIVSTAAVDPDTKISITPNPPSASSAASNVSTSSLSSSSQLSPTSSLSHLSLFSRKNVVDSTSPKLPETYEEYKEAIEILLKSSDITTEEKTYWKTVYDQVECEVDPNIEKLEEMAYSEAMTDNSFEFLPLFSESSKMLLTKLFPENRELLDKLNEDNSNSNQQSM